MNLLLVLPIALPLLGAGLALVLRRSLVAQRALSLGVLTSVLVLSVVILVQATDRGTLVSQMGDWPAPFGISLVADPFAAIMLVVSTVMHLAVLVYAIGNRRTPDDITVFHPVYLVLAAGVGASFLAGDLFNLFVAFEIMLGASFVLITLGSTREQVRSSMTYVILSLISSALFVTVVAFVYGATGTVNMAQLAERLGDIDRGVRDAIGLLLLVVFGIKAGVFPLFFWLPNSYPTAPTPVTAIFAGLLTKVGVYTIIRTETLLFPTDGPSTLLLVVASLTMVVGVLGAMAQDDVKRILSFHIISQIGYLIFGLALFTVASLAGAIFYTVHHIIVKTSLFLVAGLLEETHGTARLHRLGGLVRSAPAVALLFAIPALSLAGLPPFSGFLAKLALVEAGLDVGAGAVVGVSLAVSLLTLFSMSKIWSGVFWGDPRGLTVATSGGAPVARASQAPTLMIGATATLAALSVVVALAAGPLLELSTEAATSLLDRDSYIEAVLGR